VINICARVNHAKTLNCMLQAGPSSLHYYSAVVLHSCIVLPPVGHSSNHEYHYCQLADSRLDTPSYLSLCALSWNRKK